MILIPGRIPVAIHPFFWIMAALIGWINGRTLLGMFIWIGIVFFSVLIHEFGHALTAVVFKQKARIQLIVLGGVTSFEGPKLKFWQQFLITFNGPLFGFFLFLGATALLQMDWTGWPILYGILRATQIANLFWTIVNLLPVIPLDGGQLLRIVLEASFGIKGFKAALLIGAILSVLLAFYGFLIQQFLIGALFFLFAFQSFDSWRRSRGAIISDREEENRQLLIQGETAFQEGKKEEAKRIFENVQQKAQGGILAATASQYLAILFMQEAKHKEAYDLLLPIRDQLADDTRCMLHQLAAEYRNYSVVAEVSSECYQMAPSQEMALRNARAFAYLNQPKLAGGWLQTAWSFGGIELESVLREEEFVPLRGNPEFEEFLEKLK